MPVPEVEPDAHTPPIDPSRIDLLEAVRRAWDGWLSDPQALMAGDVGGLHAVEVPIYEAWLRGPTSERVLADVCREAALKTAVAAAADHQGVARDIDAAPTARLKTLTAVEHVARCCTTRDLAELFCRIVYADAKAPVRLVQTATRHARTLTLNERVYPH